MTIPASKLHSYIHDRPVKLRSADGAWPTGEVSPEQALALIEAGCVEGVGSPSQLRYLRLTVSAGEVLDTTTKEEQISRMVADRKFTYRKKFKHPCPFGVEEWAGLWVYQHK